MPVCVATAPCSMLPAAAIDAIDAIDAADQMDYQAGWMAALVDEELSMDADAMSFDIISTVLSRCATPPPESLAPSAVNSPYESRCQSPFDLLLDCSASSGHASLASTPYSSAPGSPSSCDYAAAAANAPCSVATNLFFSHPISSSSHPNLSFTLTMDTIDEAYDSFSSPCSPAAAATTVAPTPLNALKQARRLSKAGVETKPMKIKRVASSSSSAAVLASPTTSSVSATSTTSQISSSSPSSSSSSSAAAAAATKVSSKRMKAAALANKRDSHNISERNRRHELKVSFTALQNLVPNLLSASRAHTGTVLKETIAYINALQQQEQQLVAAKAALVAEQSLLLAAVSC